MIRGDRGAGAGDATARGVEVRVVEESAQASTWCFPVPRRSEAKRANSRPETEAVAGGNIYRVDTDDEEVERLPRVLLE